MEESWYRFGWLCSAAICLLPIVGCVSWGDRIDQIAAEAGMTKHHVSHSWGTLVAYRNRAEVAGGGRLHVYLEGDGTPWITRTRVAADPTPRNPVALDLMTLDPTSAVYLARPCYNGASAAPGCSPWHWTSGRYSEEVVAALGSALRGLIDAEALSELVLIGYSGGGVLAWLLAQRIPETQAVVTIAANLDVEAWTKLHGFSPLNDSLNPAAGPPMRPGVAQWHLVGETDQNVPPEMIEAIRAKLGSAVTIVSVASDHWCCWSTIWPGFLRRLQRSTAESVGASE